MHDWVEVGKTEPTCTKKGKREFVCKNNDEDWHTEDAATTGDIDALGHDWGAWTVTKKATTTAKGEEKRVCKRDPSHFEIRDIDKLKPEPVTAGSVYSKLKLRSLKQTKTSITLKWSKVSGASKYVLYGNKCGKTTKPKKIATYTGNTKTLKKVAGKKVKKGTYYKFIIVALDKNNNVVSTSKLIHVATKGGKVTNPKKVTVTRKGKKKAISKVTVKKGKKVTIKAKVTKASKKLKLKTHRKVKYETSDTRVATVTSKGKIKGIKKGTAYVYAYAQNGVYKRIKVTVK